MLNVLHIFMMLGAGLVSMQSKSGHYLIETVDDGKVMKSLMLGQNCRAVPFIYQTTVVKCNVVTC